MNKATIQGLINEARVQLDQMVITGVNNCVHVTNVNLILNEIQKNLQDIPENDGKNKESDG